MCFMVCCYCRRSVFHLLSEYLSRSFSCFSRLYDSRRAALHIARRGRGLLTDGELLNADDHEYSSFAHTTATKRAYRFKAYERHLVSLFCLCDVVLSSGSGGQSCRPTWHVQIPRYQRKAAGQFPSFIQLLYPYKLVSGHEEKKQSVFH